MEKTYKCCDCFQFVIVTLRVLVCTQRGRGMAGQTAAWFAEAGDIAFLSYSPEPDFQGTRKKTH